MQIGLVIPCAIFRNNLSAPRLQLSSNYSALIIPQRSAKDQNKKNRADLLRGGGIRPFCAEPLGPQAPQERRRRRRILRSGGRSRHLRAFQM
jgi:hypothetical protein